MGRTVHMKTTLRAAFWATAATVCAIAAAAPAYAASFAIRSGQSAEGLGMTYAGAASGGIGLGALAWNPSTITMFPGRQSQWNFTYILPSASYTIDGRTIANSTAVGGVPLGTGEIGGDGAFVPASYQTWQISDRLWLGLTTGAPWGLRSKPENRFYAGQIYGQSSRVRSLNVAPTIGYKVNDWLSIGAALQVQYFKAELKQALGVAAGSPGSILRGDDISWGYRFGVTLTPFQGTTIGLAYRSSIRHELEGEFVTPIPLSTVVGAGANPIKANLNLPDSIVFGVSQQINENLQAHLGVEWTNWSRFRRIPVTLSSVGGAPFTSLNFVYDDSWFFSLGAEYRLNPQWTVRAGVGYELSPVNDTNRTVRISDNDRLWLGLGASYQWSEKLKFDLAYSYLKVKKAAVNIGPGHPEYVATRPVVFFGEADPNIHIVSAGITYRWDDPKKAEAALVRKY